MQRFILHVQVFVIAVVKKSLAVWPKLSHLSHLSDFQKYVYAGGEWRYWRDIPKASDNSLAVVLGGYTGTSSIKIAQKGYKVFVFEPVPRFADDIRRRAKSRSKDIHVLEQAAATTSGQVEIVEKGEETFTRGRNTNEVRSGNGFVVSAVDFADWIRSLESTISLLEVNIEGSEYEILNHLASERVMSRINRINIQFHKISTSSVVDRQRIQTLLNQTHVQLWCFDWIWEVWEPRKSQD